MTLLPEQIIDLIAIYAFGYEDVDPDAEVAVRIRSGRPKEVERRCDRYTQGLVVEALADFDSGMTYQRKEREQLPGMRFGHSHIIRYPKGTTAERISDQCEIVDPTAGQLFRAVPPEFARYFTGNLFLGSPDRLRAAVLDPTTQLRDINGRKMENPSGADREAFFEQYWGYENLR